MVELRRFELLTSCMPYKRSSQLSYSPILWTIETLVELRRLELLTSAMRMPRSTR